MSDAPFTLADLMDLLADKAGLPPEARTTDPDTQFTDTGLDSLAFLSMQTELHDRFGVEMPEDSPGSYTLGDIVETVAAAQSQPA
jgi:acyl carrier protein